jgi:hypothetical protein
VKRSASEFDEAKQESDRVLLRDFKGLPENFKAFAEKLKIWLFNISLAVFGVRVLLQTLAGSFCAFC